MPRIAALVPMRHGSERVPGKNYRPFAGKPLYHHIVNSLLQSGVIDEVAIDTDSPTIIEDARLHFPNVTILIRPEHLRSGMTSMNDVLLHSITQVQADYYVQTHSTNPCLRPETIRRAIHLFVDSPEHDSLFGVTRLQTRLYDSQHKPLNHDPAVLLRTQDLPPVYEENSNIYVFSKGTLVENQNRLGKHPLLFEIDRAEAWDIDDELDFYVAELIFQKLAAHG